MKNLLVLIIPLWLLVGCGKPNNEPGVSTAGSWLEIRTVSHDGHKFILAQTGTADGGVSIIHHPDCECLKKADRHQ